MMKKLKRREKRIKGKKREREEKKKLKENFLNEIL